MWSTESSFGALSTKIISICWAEVNGEPVQWLEHTRTGSLDEACFDLDDNNKVSGEPNSSLPVVKEEFIKTKKLCSLLKYTGEKRQWSWTEKGEFPTGYNGKMAAKNQSTWQALWRGCENSRLGSLQDPTRQISKQSTSNSVLTQFLARSSMR